LGWDLVAWWHTHPGRATWVLGGDDPYEYILGVGDDFSKADREFVDGRWSSTGNWIVAGEGKGLWMTRYRRTTNGEPVLKHKKYGG
jgi:hypothetical protein